MRPYLRYLRITWTMFCVIAAVLLVALWVRSYWISDALWVRYSATPDIVCLVTYRGSLGLTRLFDPTTASFHVEHNDVTDMEPSDDGRKPNSLWFQILTWSGSTTILVPLWFILLTMLAASSVPWIHWPKRFSLRTLLIATTLVAVLLGLIMWSIR